MLCSPDRITHTHPRITCNEMPDEQRKSNRKEPYHVVSVLNFLPFSTKIKTFACSKHCRRHFPSCNYTHREIKRTTVEITIKNLNDISHFTTTIIPCNFPPLDSFSFFGFYFNTQNSNSDCTKSNLMPFEMQRCKNELVNEQVFNF